MSLYIIGLYSLCWLSCPSNLWDIPPDSQRMGMKVSTSTSRNLSELVKNLLDWRTIQGTFLFTSFSLQINFQCPVPCLFYTDLTEVFFFFPFHDFKGLKALNKGLQSLFLQRNVVRDCFKPPKIPALGGAAMMRAFNPSTWEAGQEILVSLMAAWSTKQFLW